MYKYSKGAEAAVQLLYKAVSMPVFFVKENNKDR